MSYIEKVVEFLATRYSICVVFNKFDEHVKIAKLEGRDIFINTESRDSIGVLFVIAHLFGHMVQLTDYEKYQYLVETVEKPKPLLPSEEFKEKFYNYELEAYQIGRGLLEVCLGTKVVNSFDEQYQIYLETDYELFFNYLETGIEVSTKTFNSILLANYTKFKGKYPEKMKSILLPKEINPRKRVLVK